MFGMHPSLVETFQKRKFEQQQLDSIQQAIEKVEFDPLEERMHITQTANMRLAALSIVLQLALMIDNGQDDVDSDEILLPSDMLDGLMLSVFDDGIDDDAGINATVKAVLSAHVADALSSLGVDDDVIEDLFGLDTDVADSAIEDASQTVLENLPDDNDLEQFIKQFAYGFDEDEADTNEKASYDGMMFDKAGRPKQKLSVGKTTTKQINGKKVKYKAVKAVRNGEIVTINKRVEGDVVLTAEQKKSIKKAQKKSNTGASALKQIRSLGKGVDNDIYENAKGAKDLYHALSGK